MEKRKMAFHLIQYMKAAVQWKDSYKHTEIA